MFKYEFVLGMLCRGNQQHLVFNSLQLFKVAGKFQQRTIVVLKRRAKRLPPKNSECRNRGRKHRTHQQGSYNRGSTFHTIVPGICHSVSLSLLMNWERIERSSLL